MINERVQAALREMRMSLDRAFGPETVMTLFGSVARCEYGPSSYVDILVLLPFEPTLSDEERVYDLAYDVELAQGVVFGIIVYSLNFWNSDAARVMPIHKNIDREGIGV